MSGKYGITDERERHAKWLFLNPSNKQIKLCSGSGYAEKESHRKEKSMTEKLYFRDAYQREFSASVIAAEGNRCLLDATTFYPGGGGQPSDTGILVLEGQEHPVSGIEEDKQGNLWHILDSSITTGKQVSGSIDWQKRFAFMRYHGLLHIANAVAMKDYQGWITGVQIGTDYARIDFNLSNFTREMISAFENRINEVIKVNHAVTSQLISEKEFNGRPELIRTLVAKPPIKNGVIRVVSIGDFDAQACGGTHVHSTQEIGLCRIEKMDNKGSKNKRFYFKLLDESQV